MKLIEGKHSQSVSGYLEHHSSLTMDMGKLNTNLHTSFEKDQIQGNFLLHLSNIFSGSINLIM